MACPLQEDEPALPAPESASSVIRTSDNSRRRQSFEDYLLNNGILGSVAFGIAR
jgi:hypothetical protein